MNHSWDHEHEKRLAAVEFPDGNGRTLKACCKCHLVKVTVHPPHGFPWNEWQHPNGRSFKCGATPPCQPSKPEVVKSA
jgi:hypothetical protein